MSERFPIATHHKKRLYAPKKRMYQLWTPRFNHGVGTLYLIPIEMPMGPLPNLSPISNLGTTLSSTSTRIVSDSFQVLVLDFGGRAFVAICEFQLESKVRIGPEIQDPQRAENSE